MNPTSEYQPASFKGVMISSTFRDLKSHRKGLMDALNKQDLHPIGMESDVALAGADIISSSLAMVRKSSAYIGLISRRYGQVLTDEKRNPEGLSVTELEYLEAQRLEIPTLIFIMGSKHPVTEDEIELDTEKRGKLAAFRETAKTGRLYQEFNSEEEFAREAIHMVAKLSQQLYKAEKAEAPPRVLGFAAMGTTASKGPEIPLPPTLYAEPPYIGSHQFVGRTSQLETLDDWASPADVHPVLLFEAIGGTGKSMLTWHWVNNHATNIRSDWAGVFWYSFYERGAVMADFCRRALAYMTRQPYEAFKKKKTLELSKLLIQQLQQRPWLIICDGLERVLVAYHRIDAARMLDEEAGTRDIIADRDPRAAIRPEDDELLRMMAGASPSKLLLTSRLTPKVLMNTANQHIPGVRAELLPGLRPKDAEALFRACGVTGDSSRIQDFLQRHCDCHPLVTGVLAGLVINYFPDRGNFDAWAADAEQGGRLNLAALDLVQKRNHIIRAALSALDEKSLELLSTLSLLSQSADYELLLAVNPYSPGGIDQSVNEEIASDKKSPIGKLETTVGLLEQSGLLQYDVRSKFYDLHPVVRGVVAGGLDNEELDKYGQKAVDYFSHQSQLPYEEVETLEDIYAGLSLIRTLLAMRRYQEAYRVYSGGLEYALYYNLNAWREHLNIASSFFTNGWDGLPVGLMNNYDKAALANNAAISLDEIGEHVISTKIYNSIIFLGIELDWESRVLTYLRNLSITFQNNNNLYSSKRCLDLVSEIDGNNKDEVSNFLSKYFLLRLLNLNDFDKRFVDIYERLKSFDKKKLSRNQYRSGSLEQVFAEYCFRQEKLVKEQLDEIERIAIENKNRQLQILNYRLRANWHLNASRYIEASQEFQEVIALQRQVGLKDTNSEIGLAKANHRLGTLSNPIQTAKHLTRQKEDSLNLAKLWHELGNQEQAKRCALAAYKTAWADGEPYVRRYDLNEAIAFLKVINVPIPNLPHFDPSKAEKFPWEDDLLTYIERLKAEIAAAKEEE